MSYSFDDLFSSLEESNAGKIKAPLPLAELLRPQTLSEIIGQDHILGENKPLAVMVASQRPSSVILWGPPGTGKTSLARLLGKLLSLPFVQVSAIFSNVSELKKIFDQARQERKKGHPTLLFVDEIHRFNRTQQDSFLPIIEDGTIILVGATTENPSFCLQPALLSRASVLTLKSLSFESLLHLLDTAERKIGSPLPLTPEARQELAALAQGDARFLLGLLEQLLTFSKENKPSEPDFLSREDILSFLQRRAPLYDRQGEQHYNLISALHKSIRGSDPQAALYYLARMLTAGEDPLFITRRLIRLASEDIGLSDPQALVQANAAQEAYKSLGSPEGELAIAQAVLYLATAPKSNSVYTAFKKATALAKATGALPPPPVILNAPTALMKSLKYGENYRYDHDEPEGFSGQNYFPQDMPREISYIPKERGFEREIKKRLEYWENLRKRELKP